MRYLPTAAERWPRAAPRHLQILHTAFFVRPEIDILENDFLVISRLGKVIEALAGAAERQPSHNNVPVRLDNPVV